MYVHHSPCVATNPGQITRPTNIIVGVFTSFLDVFRTLFLRGDRGQQLYSGWMDAVV